MDSARESCHVRRLCGLFFDSGSSNDDKTVNNSYLFYWDFAEERDYPGGESESLAKTHRCRLMNIGFYGNRGLCKRSRATFEPGSLQHGSSQYGSCLLYCNARRWRTVDSRFLFFVCVKKSQMAQLNTSDFRRGSKIILDGEPYDMVEVNFVKPGKGQALYKCRLRNLIKGTWLDRTYKSGDSLEAAEIREGDGQFLYKDASGLVFMDQVSFDQYTIPLNVAADQAKFLQDGAICAILYWGEQPIGFTAPDKAVMKVTYTEDVVRGNTSSNLTKPATLENGETVQVPAFVNTGDVIRINAQTGEYLERVRG